MSDLYDVHLCAFKVTDSSRDIFKILFSEYFFHDTIQMDK